MRQPFSRFEATPYTLEQLRADGLSEDALEAVRLLTKDEAKSYDAYIERIRSNPVARRVKLADLEDNLNVMRLKEVREMIASGSTNI